MQTITKRSIDAMKGINRLVSIWGICLVVGVGIYGCVLGEEKACTNTDEGVGTQYNDGGMSVCKNSLGEDVSCHDNQCGVCLNGKTACGKNELKFECRNGEWHEIGECGHSSDSCQSGDVKCEEKQMYECIKGEWVNKGECGGVILVRLVMSNAKRSRCMNVSKVNG